MSIRLKLKGFDDLIDKIQKANGDVDAATRKCMERSAKIMQDELQAEMFNDVQESERFIALIKRMPNYTIEQSGNRITARVGYKKGAYDPNNLSDGYKVLFLNYGTPRRKKHGKIEKRGFIQRAKKNATKKINAEQEKTLKEILKGLQE